MLETKFTISQATVTNALMTAVLVLSTFIYNGLNKRWDKLDVKMDQIIENQSNINTNIEVLKNRIDNIEKNDNQHYPKAQDKISTLLFKPEEEIKLKQKNEKTEII